jgi:hypothetical protein
MTNLDYAVYTYSLLSGLKGLIASSDNRRSVRTMGAAHG